MLKEFIDRPSQTRKGFSLLKEGANVLVCSLFFPFQWFLMGDLSKHFSRWEFECSCGCGTNQIHNELLEHLEKVRDKYGPLTVNSGCRCQPHNREVGGSPESSHLIGWAVDLRCPNSFSRFILMRHLLEEGFKRIGIGRDFLHVDADPDKPQNFIWLY